jgi:Cft2 family RNA processing exonuclease
MYFQSLTRRRGIGANSYLLDLDGARIVFDAGMDPKAEALESTPNYDLLPYDSVDGIIVSHCHLDHVGSLPVLMRQQPRARAYMTEPCGELSEAMLHNSVNVMTMKRDDLEIRDYPLFTHREIDQVQHVWEYVPTEKTFRVGDDVEVDCRFYDAGHIMGSVGTMITHNDKRIFYTGDVNFEDQTLSVGAQFPRDPVDVLIMETTRGAVQRDEAYTRDREIKRMAEAICGTLEREGSVMIPIFAMGKTQEVLMVLHLLKKEDLIPSAAIFIGGLSTKMTMIYDRFMDKVARNHRGFEILKQMELTVASRRRKRDIRYNPHCIYALSSGMMSEKTVSNKFAFEFLDNPRNSLIFVGYADPDSPAGKIRAAKKGDPIQLDPDRAPIELHCDVHEFDFSGHAIREDLRQFANDVSPKKIALVHGDDDAFEWFEQTLGQDLPESEIILIGPEDRFEI